MSKAYLITDKQMKEEILEELDLMIEEFNNYYILNKEDWETNPAYAEEREKMQGYLPDGIANYEWYAEGFQKFKETLLALPVVETIVIKE